MGPAICLLPPRIIAPLERRHAYLKYLAEQIGEVEEERIRQLADDSIAQRLLTIPGHPCEASFAKSRTAKLSDPRKRPCTLHVAHVV